MSTFLQLCQETQRECRIPGSSMTAVTSQTGELADIVAWVRESYVELSNRNGGNWRWLRRTATVDTAASDSTYASSDFTDSTDAAAISRFGDWRIMDSYDPPKIYLTSAGQGSETWLIYTDWEAFKSLYKFGAGASQTGYPRHITVDPNNNIVLGPIPDDIYTITLDYKMSPQTLAADADVPDLPAQYHRVLVYLAMQHYGGAENDTALTTRGIKGANPIIRQMEINQMPKFRKRRALA